MLQNNLGCNSRGSHEPGTQEASQIASYVLRAQVSSASHLALFWTKYLTISAYALPSEGIVSVVILSSESAECQA